MWVHIVAQTHCGVVAACELVTLSSAGIEGRVLAGGGRVGGLGAFCKLGSALVGMVRAR